jgi:hypothetical protein
MGANRGKQVKGWISAVWRWFGSGEAPVETAKTVAAFLAGAFTLVASALAVLSLSDGDVDRAVVNHPVVTVAAFVAVVAAVCLGSAMSLLDTRRAQGTAAVFGLGALALGLGLLAGAAVDGRSSKDRPRISVRLERGPDGMRVKGTVLAEGLRADEHVLVRVIGISTGLPLAEGHLGPRRGDEGFVECDKDEQKPEGSFENAAATTSPPTCWRQLAYSSRTGALPDGKVDIAIDTPLAAGLYERVDVEAQLLQEDNGKVADLREPRCDKSEGKFGCVTLMVSPSAPRPALDARWELPASSPPVLSVTAAMHGLTADDRVVLSVRRLLADGRWTRIYGAAWAPDAAGELAQTLRLVVATRNHPVCVILRAVPASRPLERSSGRGSCQRRAYGMSSVQLYRPPRS